MADEKQATELLETFEEAHDPEVISECFIIGEQEDDLVTSDTLRELWQESRKYPDEKKKFEEKKAFEGSTQSTGEVGIGDMAIGFGVAVETIEPPYDPTVLRMFLELDSVHYRAVRAKSTDSVGRGYKLDSTVPVIPDNSDDEEDVPLNAIRQSEFDVEMQRVKDFIEDCNDVVGFDGTIEKAAMDYESVGYCAVEVVRDVSKRSRKVNHVPAERLLVLRGWKGFAELIDDGGNKVYYQNFGDKVVSANRNDPVTGRPAPYDPKLDGPIDGDGAKFNLIDRKTGEPTSDITKAANEIIYKMKPHPKSIYYGIPDFVPAVSSILANVEIRDYLLQFFEHNTIPRYAIIVKGAEIDPAVKDQIQKFFSTHVKGRAHTTLLIPLPSVRGEIEVTFEKLDSDKKDGEFQEAKASNDQDIMTAHGTPPAILGIAEAASLGSGKGMSQAQTYRDRIVTPSQNSWSKCLGKLFKYGLGITTVKITFDPLDIRDLLNEMQVLTGYKDAGAIDTNEVRERAGLGEPIKGGGRKYVVTPGGIQFVDEFEEMTSFIMENGAKDKESGGDSPDVPSSEQGNQNQDLRGQGEDGN